MRARQGNDPKRRIAPFGDYDEATRAELAAELVYVGSALHKTIPGDYGFHPPVNPRPWKSICDGFRVVLLPEATDLFRKGILMGMFSPLPAGGMPKYIWSVDNERKVYEANIGRADYHGYVLGEEDDMHDFVLREWATRCRAN
jgi:hypothetical protein